MFSPKSIYTTHDIHSIVIKMENKINQKQPIQAFECDWDDKGNLIIYGDPLEPCDE